MQFRYMFIALATIAFAVSAFAKDDSVEGSAQTLALEIHGEDGVVYRATIDTTETPDLTAWAAEKLAPVVVAWYPKIVALLPSEGFEAPKSFTIIFTSEYRGVAATAGTRVLCSPDWFRNNLEGEAIGAVVHELVHVVQQYRWGRRTTDGQRPPGWLIEGIPDYIRWFLFEPQTRGAEIGPDRVAGARYDGSYRVSANFLNWAVAQHGQDMIPKLNAALREGRYNEELWNELTGKSVDDLGIEWKVSLERNAAAPQDLPNKSAVRDSAETATR